jgi:hypothetical protein
VKTNGSPRANYMNVRNWMFDRRLKQNSGRLPRNHEAD